MCTFTIARPYSLAAAGNIRPGCNLLIFDAYGIIFCLCWAISSRLISAAVKLLLPNQELTKSKGKGTQEAEATNALLEQSSVIDCEAVERVLSLLSATLLPALSIAPPNCFLNGMVWGILGPLPFHLRYSAYDRWRGASFGKDAIGIKSTELAAAEVKTLLQAKMYAKRLSKETEKQVGGPGLVSEGFDGLK